METSSLEAFWAAYGQTVLSVSARLVACVLILAVCKGATLVARRIIGAATRRRLDPTLAPVLRTVIAVGVWAVGGVAVLGLFGVNANGLVALIGAAGLTVGLALKDTLSNIAAGLMLLVLRPFRAGDAVDCGPRTGTVEAVGLFTTVLRTADGLYVSIPNRTVWAADVVNYTRNGRRRLSVSVGIAYGDSIDRGLETLLAVAAGEARLLPDPAPSAAVTALGDSAVTLTLRGWTTVEDYWPTVFDLNRRVKLSIEEAGLSIPFPQRDVHLIPHP